LSFPISSMSWWHVSPPWISGGRTMLQLHSEVCALVLGVSNSINARFLDFSGIAWKLLLHIPWDPHLNLVLGNLFAKAVSEFLLPARNLICENFSKDTVNLLRTSHVGLTLLAIAYNLLLYLSYLVQGEWSEMYPEKMKHVNEQINFNRKIRSKPSLKFVGFSLFTL